MSWDDANVTFMQRLTWYFFQTKCPFYLDLSICWYAKKLRERWRGNIENEGGKRQTKRMKERERKREDAERYQEESKMSNCIEIEMDQHKKLEKRGMSRNKIFLFSI